MIKASFFTLLNLILNLLYGLDVFVNIAIGGDRRETISSRLGKGKRARKPVHLILSYPVDMFFFIFEGKWDHCERHIQHFDDHYSFSSTWDRHRPRS